MLIVQTAIKGVWKQPRELRVDGPFNIRNITVDWSAEQLVIHMMNGTMIMVDKDIVEASVESEPAKGFEEIKEDEAADIKQAVEELIEEKACDGEYCGCLEAPCVYEQKKALEPKTTPCAEETDSQESDFDKQMMEAKERDARREAERPCSETYCDCTTEKCHLEQKKERARLLAEMYSHQGKITIGVDDCDCTDIICDHDDHDEEDEDEPQPKKKKKRKLKEGPLALEESPFLPEEDDDDEDDDGDDEEDGEQPKKKAMFRKKSGSKKRYKYLSHRHCYHDSHSDGGNTYIPQYGSNRLCKEPDCLYNDIEKSQCTKQNPNYVATKEDTLHEDCFNDGLKGERNTHHPKYGIGRICHDINCIYNDETDEDNPKCQKDFETIPTKKKKPKLKKKDFLSNKPKYTSHANCFYSEQDNENNVDNTYTPQHGPQRECHEAHCLFNDIDKSECLKEHQPADLTEGMKEVQCFDDGHHGINRHVPQYGKDRHCPWDKCMSHRVSTDTCMKQEFPIVDAGPTDLSPPKKKKKRLFKKKKACAEYIDDDEENKVNPEHPDSECSDGACVYNGTETGEDDPVCEKKVVKPKKKFKKKKKRTACHQTELDENGKGNSTTPEYDNNRTCFQYNCIFRDTSQDMCIKGLNDVDLGIAGLECHTRIDEEGGEPNSIRPTHGRNRYCIWNQCRYNDADIQKCTKGLDEPKPKKRKPKSDVPVCYSTSITETNGWKPLYKEERKCIWDYCAYNDEGGQCVKEG